MLTKLVAVIFFLPAVVKASLENQTLMNSTSIVEKPVIFNQDNPCIVGSDIWKECDQESSTDTQMSNCMKSKNCCSVADPTVQYVPCPPTPTQPPAPKDKRALWIASTVGPVATILGCIAVYFCRKNRDEIANRPTAQMVRNIFAEGGRQNQQAQAGQALLDDRDPLALEG